MRGGRGLAVIQAEDQPQMVPLGSSGPRMFFRDALNWGQMARPVYALTDQSWDVSHAGKGHPYARWVSTPETIAEGPDS